MTIWLWSDPHFGHVNLVQGTVDKPPSRPEFVNVADMNEALVDRVNALVKPSDHLYCLGDVAMDKASVEAWVPKLHGHKRLILGNHDVHGVTFYKRFFQKVMAYRVLDDMLLSHVPVAPWSLRWRANVHGHCHLAKPLLYDVTDPDLVGFGRKARYVNLSVERTRFRPVSLEEVSSWVKT